jgi:hypothetical protein
MTSFCHKEKHSVRTFKGPINENKEQRNESEKSSSFSTYYLEQFGVVAITRFAFRT